MSERQTLWVVLTINFAFFVLEAIAGLIAGSMGLVADSLDMLADATVYGLSLLAVDRAQRRKRAVARSAGYLQLALAAVGLIEVVRRFVSAEPPPDFQVMITVACLALVANAASLWILERGRSRGPHMRASMIFTSNDLIINAGVIVAGIGVLAFGSNVPDLVVGAIVFGIVARGAFRILGIAASDGR